MVGLHSVFSTGFLKMFVLAMGYVSKKMPLLWGYVFKILPWLWVHPLDSHRHMYTRQATYMSHPPFPSTTCCIFLRIYQQYIL